MWKKWAQRGREVILGMTRDPQFGPMLMFGLGGIFVEVMKDVTFHLAPITAEEAMQMLKGTRSYALLQGARGQAPVDLEAIAGALQRISQLVTDYPEIMELDINPFIVGPVGVQAYVADARMTLSTVAAKHMSKTITYDPNWQETYKLQVLTAAEAVKKIRPGQRVFIGTGTGEPLELVSALSKRAYELPDTEIIHLLTFGDAPYAHKELAQYFRVNSFFIAENVRDIIQEGLGDYTPVFLSDIPRLFNSGQLPLDVALIHVTPPDAHGMCSFGVSVDIIRSAAENASLVIAQVNPNMPRTLGDCFIHVNDIDVLVPSEAPILEVPPAEATETTRQIAEYIAALIEDGSTIEFGIGRIPQAMFSFLKDKKDLGVHTEMVTDNIIELIECGAINGNRKSLDRGKIVASFCLGTKKIYDYVDNNPLFAFHPRNTSTTRSSSASRTKWWRSTPRWRSTSRDRCAPIRSAPSFSPASAARWISIAARPNRAAARPSSRCLPPPRAAPSRAS